MSKTISCRMAGAAIYDISEGDTVYLADTVYHGQGDTEASARPYRKNMSHEECLHGWVGETDNVSRTARGTGTVVSIDEEENRIVVRADDAAVEVTS
ncbi:MAG: hypothetical protein ACRENK_16390 [Gemmatimonadaceae bacterium]